jgi:hypothetical protein
VALYSSGGALRIYVVLDMLGLEDATLLTRRTKLRNYPPTAEIDLDMIAVRNLALAYVCGSVEIYRWNALLTSCKPW